MKLLEIWKFLVDESAGEDVGKDFALVYKIWDE